MRNTNSRTQSKNAHAVEMYQEACNRSHVKTTEQNIQEVNIFILFLIKAPDKNIYVDINKQQKDITNKETKITQGNY